MNSHTDINIESGQELPQNFTALVYLYPNKISWRGLSDNPSITLEFFKKISISLGVGFF